MPWRSTSYRRVYYFRRRRMIWISLVVCLIVGFFWLVTDHYLADATYVPIWHFPRCHGRRCGGALMLYIALFLFLLLPVWIKMGVSMSVAGEFIARVFALLVWSFDRRPDFAIGPYGVYGLSGIRYHHVAWSQVKRVRLTDSATIFGVLTSMTIVTRKKTPSRSLLGKRRSRAIVFTLAPVHGLPIREVFRQIRSYAPDIEAQEVQIDRRPYWLRW